MQDEEQAATPKLHGPWRLGSRGPEPNQPPRPPRLASSEDPMDVPIFELPALVEEWWWNSNELTDCEWHHGRWEAYPRGPSLKLIECCKLCTLMCQ